MDLTVQQTMPWLKDASPLEMTHAIEALHHVHGFMAALTDIDTLLERISEEGRLVARAEAASVMLYDERSEELYFFVALGDSGDQEVLKREVRLKLGQGIAGAAALERATIHVPDVEKDHRFFRGADKASRFQTRNILAVPMVERNRLIGVLELVNKIGDEAFSPLDQHVMEMFSSVAASAVANARLIEQQIKNERLAAIGQAIAGLTHHIKNILTGLNSSAELIDLAMAQDNGALVKKTWPVLRRSTYRISNFVQDLLTFVKSRKPMMQACDAHHLLIEVCETMRDLVEKKKIALNVEISENLTPLQADPDALFRCLMNLVSNAVDAVPENSGIIRISARKSRQDRLEIYIADNGPGIPVEMRDKVFEIFFSTKGTRGTGLGLACAAKIAQEHGGELALVESAKGACFCLYLPVMELCCKDALEEDL